VSQQPLDGLPKRMTPRRRPFKEGHELRQIQSTDRFLATASTYQMTMTARVHCECAFSSLTCSSLARQINARTSQ
jgi:hypothetical protein